MRAATAAALKLVRIIGVMRHSRLPDFSHQLFLLDPTNGIKLA